MAGLKVDISINHLTTIGRQAMRKAEHLRPVYQHTHRHIYIYIYIYFHTHTDIYIYIYIYIYFR